MYCDNTGMLFHVFDFIIHYFIIIIIFNPKYQVRLNEELRLQGSNNTVSVSSPVKNLGVYFDTSLATERQVNPVSKACYYQIRNIGHIRRYITLEACKTLAHALITSRLDSKHTDDTATESTEFFCQVSHTHS